MNQEFVNAMQQYIQYVHRRSPTSSSSKHYQSDLEQFCRVVDKPPRHITARDITDFVNAQLAAHLSPATVNRRVSVLSQFFNYLAIVAEDEQWVNPVNSYLHRVQVGTHLPRHLTEDVVRPFWTAVQRGPVRDQAIVALMLDVGLRVGEVAALEVEDFAGQRAEGLAALRVKGKGNKERQVWLVKETARLIETWLRERPPVQSKALFITRRRGGFTVRGIQDRVKHYTRQAGLALEQISCHRLRHTFARRMAEMEMPLASLSYWLGHNQVQTTQIYTAGANLTVRADYETAMNHMSAVAECPEASTPAMEWAVSDQGEAPSQLAAPPSLTPEEIEAKLATLPAWLQAHLLSFLRYKQVRWSRYHQRERTIQWCSLLRRAWQWLLDEYDLVDLADLRQAHLSAYLTHLFDLGRSANTRNHTLSVFWAFLRFVEANGEAISPALYRVPRTRTTPPLPRPLTEGEYQRLQQTVQTTLAQASPAISALDYSWFFILCDGGLRISELVTLSVAAWDSSSNQLLVQYGKGNRQRRVPLSERAAQVLSAHLKQRSTLTHSQPLLMLNDQPLTKQYVRQRLHTFAEQAGLTDVTPHRLRHTYATRLLNIGRIPITSLQQLMGHQRLDTTMRYVLLYDQTVQQDYQAAIRRLQPVTDLDWAVWGMTIEAVLDKAETPIHRHEYG